MKLKSSLAQVWWVAANAIAAVLIVPVWPLMLLDLQQTPNAYLQVGPNADFIILLITLVLLAGHLLLPAFALRNLTNTIPVWLWVLGMMAYAFVYWLLLDFLGKPLTVPEYSLYGHSMQRSSASTWAWFIHFPWWHAILASLIFPVACIFPTVAIAAYRESIEYPARNRWPRPATFGFALVFGSWVTGLAGYVIDEVSKLLLGSLTMFPRTNLLVSLNTWDLVVVFLAAAAGAYASSVVLLQGEARTGLFENSPG